MLSSSTAAYPWGNHSSDYTLVSLGHLEMCVKLFTYAQVFAVHSVIKWCLWALVSQIKGGTIFTPS